MRRVLFDVLLFVLASPVLAIRALAGTHRRYRFLRLATIPRILCECGATVSLVGMWRCGCGFTYRGHLLRACPVCGSLPRMVRCYRCRVTLKLPEEA